VCWWEGSSTAWVRGGDSVSWKPLAASLTLQRLKVRGDDVLSLFLLELWSNGAAFSASILLQRHWRIREVEEQC